jgi:hypothetical protein
VGARDKVLGQTPFKTHLEPGEYVLFLTKKGYKAFETRFEVRGSMPMALSFQMAEDVSLGGIKVSVNVAGAEIYIDGKLHGLSPFSEVVQVRSGRHQIVARKEGYTHASSVADVKSGQTVEAALRLGLEDVPYSWRGYVGWTCLGLGAAGIGTGVVLYGVFDKKYFEGTNTLEDYQLYQTLAYAGGAGLMLAGTGLVLWEHLRDATSEDAALMLAPLPGGGAVVVGGVF